MDNSRRREAIGFLVLILALGLMGVLGQYFHLDAEALQNSLARYPLLVKGIFFIVLYVGVTFFLFFSKDLFWLTGAILFGAAASTLFISISEIINACILFRLARTLGRAYVDKTSRGSVRGLDEKIGRASFGWLFLFRVAPLIPYRFLDLAAGLTSLRFRRYLAAVVLGTPLKTYWMQSVLAAVGETIYKDPYAAAEYILSQRGLWIFSVIYCLLVILAVVKITRRG